MPLIVFKEKNEKPKKSALKPDKKVNEIIISQNDYHKTEEFNNSKKDYKDNNFGKSFYKSKTKRQDLTLLFKDYAKTNFNLILNSLQSEIINYLDKMFLVSKDKNAYTKLSFVKEKFRHYKSNYFENSLKQLVELKIVHLINDIKTKEVKCRLSTDLILKSQSEEFEDDYHLKSKNRFNYRK